MSLSIAIVCGSVRKNRRSIVPAHYLVEQVKAAGYEATLVDFTTLPLPFVNTPVPPGDLHGTYEDAHVSQWSSIAAAADAFIFVSPEYNHGYSAVMKNALDWLYDEFDSKPVGLVGVSDGMVGGARMIEQLRTVCGGFGLFDVKPTVMFRTVQNVFDEQGKLVDASYERPTQKLIATVAEAAEAMKALRKSST